MEILQSPDRLSSFPEPIGRRATIFIGVLAFHLCIIVLLVLSRHAVQPQHKQGSLSVFALAASPNPPAIQIPDPIIPVDGIAIISSPAQAHAAQQSAEGYPDGEVCSPVDAVTAQLTNDPIVPAAISLVPRSDRSISEAIVMWNAEWSEAAAAADAPLAEVRNRILVTLENLPPECLAMPVAGPRLIPIVNGDSTTFLAFGSGEWSWRQLIEPVDEIPASQENSWTWEELFAENISPKLF